MNSKGIVGDVLKDIVLWIIFLVLAGAGVYFLLKQLGT